MCGIKSRLYSVILVLCLLASLPLYSESVYSVTESQLLELEKIQKEQEELIEKQKLQEESLKKQQELLTQEIKDLEKSSQKSELTNKILKIAVPVCSVLAFGGGLYLGYKLSQ